MPVRGDLPEGAAEIGGTTYHALCNDFGPSSIDGWLTDLAAREMLIDNQAPLDPGRRRQLILDGTRADLTKLEWDVLQYLHEREGRIASRAALLRHVWGYDWTPRVRTAAPRWRAWSSSEHPGTGPIS